MFKSFILGTVLTLLGLSLFDWLQKGGDVFNIYNPPKKWRFRSLQWFCYLISFLITFTGGIMLFFTVFEILQNVTRW